MAKVLIVDDRAEMAGIMAALLTRMGHETCFLDSAADVLSTSEAFQPDVAFVDIAKPTTGLNSFDLARQLRQQSARLRLFGMSALPVNTWPKEDTGLFEQFLLKPISSRTMMALVGELRRG